MSYGVTTGRAHLDRLDPAAPQAGEIDWDELVGWVTDHSAPTFAGRYFLGTATQAEVDAGMAAGTGFCLWAHGEGKDPSAPRLIVPLQRADPERQQAIGALGQSYGTEDAQALGGYLDQCLAVGDLSLSTSQPILVFLEVADGTVLSVDYWSAWATAIHEATLLAALSLSQPLVPAISCAFVFDDASQKYMPEEAVRDCLEDHIPGAGRRIDCHGLWARRLPGDPALATHPFDWTAVGVVRQPVVVLGVTVYYRDVPVRYLRWFDGPAGLAIPAGPLLDTLTLLTLDWSASDGDDPTQATFTATDWCADRRDGSGLLLQMPSQLGVDAGGDLTRKAGTLGTTNIVVTSLSYDLPATPVNLVEPCTFAVRYYRTGTSSRLTVPEAQALSASGIQVAAVFQGYAHTDQGDTVYANDLIRPFNNHEGSSDGEKAFIYAADTMKQPAYTPIYFSVDFPVDTTYYGVQMPSLATVLRYFQDVHRGYRDYLLTHPSNPYYVGVYGYPELCEELYRAGLASHFWQPPWGAGSPFAHLNLWQVGMFNTPACKADNPVLMAGDDYDIDAAWGDPGAWWGL